MYSNCQWGCLLEGVLIGIGAIFLKNGAQWGVPIRKGGKMLN